MATVTIPVFAKVRIGHFVEAQILESLGVDMIDESEVLSPADDEHHIDKGKKFKVRTTIKKHYENHRILSRASVKCSIT